MLEGMGGGIRVAAVGKGGVDLCDAMRNCANLHAPPAALIFRPSPAFFYTPQAGDLSDTAIQRLIKSIASLSTACQMLSVSRIPDGQEHTAKLIALCGERATILGRILLKRLVLYIVAQ